MNEPLKTSILLTVLISSLVGLVLVLIHTGVFGLVSYLTEQTSRVTTGFYDKDEKVSGFLFVSSQIASSSAVRLQRVTLEDANREYITFSGVGQYIYGLEKQGDLYLTIESGTGPTQSYRNTVVVRRGTEVVETIGFEDVYIVEATLSPTHNKLALVLSHSERDFSSRVAAPDAEVVLYTISNKQIVSIGKGVSPQWESHGKYVVYLADEGVMVYNTMTGEQKNGLLLTDAQNSEYEALALSGDGKNIAVAVHGLGVIRIYKILRWEDFVLDVEEEHIALTSRLVFNPVFSPMGKYVLFITQYENGDTEGVSVYDRTTGYNTRLKIKDSGMRLLLLNDWVKF